MSFLKSFLENEISQIESLKEEGFYNLLLKRIFPSMHGDADILFVAIVTKFGFLNKEKEAALERLVEIFIEAQGRMGFRLTKTKVLLFLEEKGFSGIVDKHLFSSPKSYYHTFVHPSSLLDIILRFAQNGQKKAALRILEGFYRCALEEKIEKEGKIYLKFYGDIDQPRESSLYYQETLKESDVFLSEWKEKIEKEFDKYSKKSLKKKTGFRGWTPALLIGLSCRGNGMMI